MKTPPLSASSLTRLTSNTIQQHTGSKLPSLDLGICDHGLLVQAVLLIRALLVCMSLYRPFSISTDEELLVIQISEQPVEDRRTDEPDDSWDGKAPDEVRILNSFSCGKRDGGADGCHEQRESHYESLHVRWSTRVGDSVGSHVDEDFGAGCDTDGESVEPERQRRDTGSLFTSRGLVTAGRGLVDVVLENGEAHCSNGGDDESEGHAGDGAESDAHLAETRVNEMVHDRDENDDGKRVEIIKDIVGHAVRCERRRLSVGSSTETTVVDLLDGEKQEDGTCAHGSSDILNELIVVFEDRFVAVGCHDRWLDSLPVTWSAEATNSGFAECQEVDGHEVTKCTSSGWKLNQRL